MIIQVHFIKFIQRIERIPSVKLNVKLFCSSIEMEDNVCEKCNHFSFPGVLRNKAE